MIRTSKHRSKTSIAKFLALNLTLLSFSYANDTSDLDDLTTEIPSLTEEVVKTAEDSTTDIKPLKAEIPASKKQTLLSQEVNNDTSKRNDFPYASPASGRSQDIEKVLSATYNYNSEIQAQRAAVRAADEKVVQAKAGYRPNLALESQASMATINNSGTQKDQSILSPSRQETRLGQANLKATQNIFQGFNTSSSVAEAESNRLAAVLQLTATVQKVFSDAVQAYLNLLSLTAQVRLLKSQVNTSQETLKAAQEKFKVGEETRTSVAQAESQLADFTAQMQAREAQLEGAKATFTRVTGVQPQGIVKPKEFTQIPATLAAAIEKAIVNNPSVQAAKYTAEAAAHTKDKVTSALYPKIDLEASSGYTRTNTRTRPTGITPNAYDNQVQHQAVLRASVPLYEAGLVRAQRREAHEASEKARIDIETARRQVIEQLTQAWSNFKTAKANMTSYRAQVAAQEISLEGTRQEMAVGTKILLDVLDEQSKLVQAQQNLVNAERDYYLAGYQLMSLLGILTETEMKLDVERYDPEAHYREVKDSW